MRWLIVVVFLMMIPSNIYIFSTTTLAQVNSNWSDGVSLENDKVVAQRESTNQLIINDYRKGEISSNIATFYSISSDGDADKYGYDYYETWSASSAEYVFDNLDDIYVGQYYLGYPYYEYAIFRSFLFFDTSSLPDEAVITSATLSLYGSEDWSTYDFKINIQNGQPEYPHNPIVANDYYNGYYSGDGGSFYTSGFTTNGYNDIQLDAEGMDWINKQGTTKFCLRSDQDINYWEPYEDQFVIFYSSEKGESFQPKLTVEYDSPDLPDLTVTDIWIDPSSFYPDDLVDIWMTIENIGSGDAIDYFYVDVFLDGDPIGWGYIPGLNAGTSLDLYLQDFSWPPDTSWHTITVTVDTDNDIVESNENNNIRDEDFKADSVPLPQVTTNPASNVESTYATLNGYLSDLGGSGSCDVWFEWGTTTNYGHTTSLQTRYSCGSFYDNIIGLTPETTYHFRAVASSSAGTAYGDDVTFYTPPNIDPPVVYTDPATNIETASATLNGYLHYLGGDISCDVWFEYGTTSSYGQVTPHQTQYVYGSFYEDITGLLPETTYHFRAVAQNSVGIDYGDDFVFTTLELKYPPSVETKQATNIDTTSATLNGYLDDLGGEDQCTVWFEWGTTQSYGYYTYAQNKGDVGPFENYLTDLTPDTTYHFRAAAQNDQGVSYGEDISFTTLNSILPPAVDTDPATNIEYTSATLNGFLADLGGANSCDVWFEWGTTTSYGYTTPPQTQYVGGEFDAFINGLDPDTTYHFRAVGSNSAGTDYGNDQTFHTLKQIYPPHVSTNTATNVKETSATLNGNLIDLGGAASCNVWFEYGTSSNYGYQTSPKKMNSMGNFNDVIVNLNQNTIYHFRAVAQNGGGTSYGDDLTFRTSSNELPEWTILIYLDGDNNLESYGIEDFNEMEVAGSSDKVNIIVLFDRWSFGDTVLYKVLKDPNGLNQQIISEVLNDSGAVIPPSHETNMGDPQTLINFCTWGMSNYTAKHYGLIFWDHGNGWKDGGSKTTKHVCVDDNSGYDSLELYELKDALQTITENGSNAFNLIGFDACLMQMIEVGYEIAPYGRYMTASEETEPAVGWNYDDTLLALVANPTMPTELLGKKIVNDFINESGDTLSIVNLSLFNYIREDVSDLAFHLKSELFKNGLINAMNDAKRFDDYDYADLYNLVELIQQYITNATVNADAQTVLNELNNVVIYEKHNYKGFNAHGLSIYAPKYSYDPNYGFLEFAKDSYWDDFLNWYHNGPLKFPPDEPRYPSPYNGETNVSTTVRLKVYVSDHDGDTLNVSFYDVSTGFLIDQVNNVLSDTNVTCLWSGLSIHTTYNWNVEVSDGSDVTIGPVWNFTTGEGLWADTYNISASTGGTINLILDVGPDYANRKYVIGGSITGTNPGIPLPGSNNLTLPLTWDGFTTMIKNNLNNPGLTHFLGTFDENGKAYARFNRFKPIPTQYIGKKIYFAFATRDPWDYVSNPISIEIVD